MLLLDIEEQYVKPLSQADKEQLLWDVWRMLNTKAGPDASQGVEGSFTPGQPVGEYAPIDTPHIAKRLEALL